MKRQLAIGLTYSLLSTAALWGQATNVFPSSGNVGIGTTAPTSPLQVVGNASFSGSVRANSGFWAGNTQVYDDYFLLDIFGIQPTVYLTRSNGTATAPTALAAGDILGELNWNGNDGVSGCCAGGAGIRAQASQAFTTSAHGTNLNFFTTPTNSNSSWQNYPARMTITGNGSVGVGTTTPGYQLDVQAGQINSSGGYCINGTNCITAWPTGGGGSGTVTSITAGSGLSGGTITTSGTRSLNLANANAWAGVQSFGANTNFPGGIWNSSGSVGIGTTAPTDLLMVNTSLNDVGITLRGAAASVSPSFKIANASGAVFGRVGIAGSAGSLVAGSSANDFVIRGENQNLLITTNGGTSAVHHIRDLEK